MKIVGEKQTWYVWPDVKAKGKRYLLDLWVEEGLLFNNHAVQYSSCDRRPCIKVLGTLEEACQAGTFLKLIEDITANAFLRLRQYQGLVEWAVRPLC